MRFDVKGRTIQQHGTRLGMQGDNKVETLEFVMPKMYGDVDLSTGIAFMLLSTASGTKDFIPDIVKTVEDENIVLTWLVGSQATKEVGALNVEIKISGIEDELWHSEITMFQVGRSIAADSPQNPAMRSKARMANPDTEPPITVVERKIMIPTALQNIAVQDDENSETVLWKLPRYFDGHDLSEYNIFLKTIMPQDGGRDDILWDGTVLDATTISWRWTLKPPQTSFSGKVQLQVYVIGTTPDGKPFKWETDDSASVNIMRSLDAEPVGELTPSIMDDFIKRLTEIEQRAKTSETNAKTSETNAAESAQAAQDAVDNIGASVDDAAKSAEAAALSAGAARKSEESAKLSETASVVEADRATDEAERAKEEADRAAAAAGFDPNDYYSRPQADARFTLLDEDTGKLSGGQAPSAKYIGVDALAGLTADNAQTALFEINDKTVGVYEHLKIGTVHTLTGAGANIKFKATASFADGDTWLVNGASVTAKTVDGQGLNSGDIISGSVILAVLEGGLLWFQIRSYHTELSNKANVNAVYTKAQTDAVLSGKANVNAVYTKAQTDAVLSGKANLNSPALTGTPTAPTAPQTVNSTQLATTAYVQAGLLAKGLPSTNFPGADANLAISQGVYVCGTGIANAPSNYGLIVVFRGSNVYISQLFFGMVDNSFFRRISSSGGASWSSWA